MKDHYFHNKIVKLCRAESRRIYNAELELHEHHGTVRPDVAVRDDVAIEVVALNPRILFQFDKYRAKYKKLIVVIPGEESIDVIWLYNVVTDELVKTAKIINPNKEGIKTNE